MALRALAMLLPAARLIRTVNIVVFRLMAWCAVALVGTVLTVVVLRYGFGVGMIALQESAQYLHAAVFLLGAAGVVALDGHVRVDVLRARFAPRLRDRIEIGGHLLLLLPLALFVLWASLPYVAESWRIRESSPSSAGLPFVFLWKTLIPVAAAQLALQALASAVMVAGGAASTAPRAHDEPL